MARQCDRQSAEKQGMPRLHARIAARAIRSCFAQGLAMQRALACTVRPAAFRVPPASHASTTFRSLALLQERAMRYSESEINQALIRLFRRGYAALTRRERDIVDELAVIC